MKILRKWNFKSIAGKMMMGLALAAMIVSIGVEPAHAKNDKGGRHDNGRYQNDGRHDNGRYQHRGRGYKRQVHARPVYRPYGNYGHRERVYYPPPPVVYAPPPPPGIGIFFPPIFIHP